MKSIGWAFIILAAFIVTAVTRGRVSYIGQDVTDAFTAVVSGNSTKLKEVLSRKGEDATATEFNTSNLATAATDIGGVVGGVIARGLGPISAEAIKLGNAAKGYRFGATGPDYYDCSGLMYRACQKTGNYTGGRFTTFTIGLSKQFRRIPNAQIDAIVVWPTHHMGVVTGTDKYYSARSVASGIGYSAISKTYPNITPRYYVPVDPSHATATESGK